MKKSKHVLSIVISAVLSVIALPGVLFGVFGWTWFTFGGSLIHFLVSMLCSGVYAFIFITAFVLLIKKYKLGIIPMTAGIIIIAFAVLYLPIFTIESFAKMLNIPIEVY